jgi:hypothetical protein
LGNGFLRRGFFSITFQIGSIYAIFGGRFLSVARYCCELNGRPKRYYMNIMRRILVRQHTSDQTANSRSGVPKTKTELVLSSTV